MKKLMYIIAATATLVVAGCKKEKIDPEQPSIAWESNPGFGQVELLNSLDAVVTASAPGKFQELKLTLNLGTFNILANPYISISANKGGSLNPVLDLMGDASCVSLANGLGMSVGQSLNNRTEVKLNLKAFLEKILQGQVVDNNTTLGIDIKVVDQNGKSAVRTAKFHFTAAPVISWPKNPNFAVVELDTETDCKVGIWAPGKIESLTVKLEDGREVYRQAGDVVKYRGTEKYVAGQIDVWWQPTLYSLDYYFIDDNKPVVAEDGTRLVFQEKRVKRVNQ